MRRTFFGIALAAMFGFVAGCSDEQQFDQAVENQQEEVTDLQQEQLEATADGTVTSDELEDVEDQREEVTDATGEVAEQTGDLIESKTD